MTPSALATAGLVWAAVALGVQVVAASRGEGPDYGRRAGSRWRGIAYNFTAAMTPAHKESVHNHPVEFGIGVVLHAGALLALAAVVLAVLRFEAGASFAAALRPLFATSFLAGLALFVRRIRSANLRAMSVPDDFVAILATCGLVALAAVAGEPAGRSAFLVYAGVFLLYFPLGKLRHAVFFFVARADYGARMGYRGVYPPARAGK